MSDAHPLPKRRSRPSPVSGVPLNTFGMSFGLMGLAGTWTEAARSLGISIVAGEIMWIVATIVWITTITLYLIRARSPRRIMEDLTHPVLGPFAALVPISGLLLGGHLFATWPIVGTILV